MEQQLIGIPAVLAAWRSEGEADQRGQVVGLALGRCKAQRVPARFADVAQFQAVPVMAAQRLVVLGALAAVPVVGEVLGLADVGEGGVDLREEVRVARHEGLRRPLAP
ncbi:hypothetical protein [Azotobacter chroococcum]|uniref:Uncharacterized protein n=1 Tax=Azotobacter chroococcum TaxID=353 RepID=A0AAP9Y962_9GAMM|nr:hypothetical protein [Azotobacter chroococcum]QQE87107.1 hypothetical protein GKQ51_12305 [Azotobacter chroococcum]